MRTSETIAAPSSLSRRLRLSIPWRLLAGISFSALIGLILLGSSMPRALQATMTLDAVTRNWNWDFVGWEIQNVGRKLNAQLKQPAAHLDAEARADLVRSYLARAQTIGGVEFRLDELYAQPPGGAEQAAPSPADAAARHRLETQLDLLYEQQALVRPAVEQIIEGQVAAVLATEQLGIGLKPFPPVWFTSTEPPRKLVVSPRDHIATSYYAMLQPALPPDEREQIETTIFQQHDLSAYVTSIGGLGAYPTIVVDQAPLAWVLNTVAHEWVHNYLTLFPLGINYAAGPELTILNETVAEIAGDELGAVALAAYYPELVREFAGKDQPAPSPQDAQVEQPFDFRREMRHTREVVDLFLMNRRVEDAEEYMQIRRQLFEENGYILRKLNQAYFAFHGSYGTGAAATSPIGPKLQRLRELSPNIQSFLETVRWFTSEADLDAALDALAVK